MIGTNSFRGEVPALTPRALPDNAAQEALNARLQTGDLEAWRQFLTEKLLANTGPVQTIYKLNDVWLSWNEVVDVARGLIPGDDTFRTFITAPALYDRPRFTTYDLATSGAEPLPFATRPLGVGNPTTEPTLVVGVDTSEDAAFSVNVLDAGDSLNGSWTTSSNVNEATFSSNVVQDGANGLPTAPSYLMSVRDQEYGTHMRRNFGIAEAATVRMEFDFRQTSHAGYAMFFAGVMRPEEDATGISVRVDLHPSIGWAVSLGTGGGWGQGQSHNGMVGTGALPGGTIVEGNTYTMRIDVVRNVDNTQRVTVNLFDQGSTTPLFTPLETTMTAELGDFCGFGMGIDQIGAPIYTRFDNIHVTASGTFGYAPALSGTNYVFTYRNDLAQESGPSPVSATVSRADGVAVTVTTPTTLPGGYSEDGITEKLIYRAVTGSGGTVYKLVAVIPLAQADYVDTLSDDQTGAVLISEDWDRPPDELQGIIALPNDTMAGFFRNQLCFSAQGYPHAWPVRYRKTTDTDIVAINNLDATVVVGTKSVVYTATGTDPSNYTMSQPGEKQACVSKRSMVFLDGFGVVFASPDGYQLCAGAAGSLRNLTNGVFTRKQWQSYRPESILAAVHDGVLHWWWDNEPPVVTAFFLDNFSGTLGTALSLHAPDVAPDGFAYMDPPFGSEMELDGEGNVIAADGSFAQSTEAFDPMVLGTHWRMEMAVDIGGGSSEGGPSTEFVVRSDADPNGLRIAFVTSNDLVYVQALSETMLLPYQARLTEGEHTAVLHVSPTGFQLMVDGVLRSALNGDTTALLSMDDVYLGITGLGEEGQVPKVSRIACYPNSTPQPEVSAGRIKTVGLDQLFQYQTDTPGTTELEGDPFTAAGALGGISDIDLATDGLLIATATGACTGNGNAVAVTALAPKAFEVVVDAIAPGYRCAVGIYPTGGPAFDGDEYLGNTASGPTWVCALEANADGSAGGVYDGAGGLTAGAAPFLIGDVIGFVVQASSGFVDVYVNGTQIDTLAMTGTTVMPFVSFALEGA
jgi:hypothetical protein